MLAYKIQTLGNYPKESIQLLSWLKIVNAHYKDFTTLTVAVTEKSCY